jgi:hypothetical protein
MKKRLLVEKSAFAAPDSNDLLNPRDRKRPQETGEHDSPSALSLSRLRYFYLWKFSSYCGDDSGMLWLS